MAGGYFILKGGEPIAVDAMTWGQWLEAATAEYEPGHIDSRRVAAWERDGIAVSTVFLGLDHQWRPTGPPLIFETLVTGGPLDEEMDRYTTRTETLVGHERIVARVRAALDGDAEAGP
jgi:hypothetical protein